jgi:hypothetical protein
MIIEFLPPFIPHKINKIVDKFCLTGLMPKEWKLIKNLYKKHMETKRNLKLKLK